DQHTALALRQPSMAGEREQARGAVGTPARRLGDGSAFAAVIEGELLAVGLDLAARQRALDQQMMEEEIVEREDPRMIERRLEDALVMEVVAHLVEGHTTVLADPVHRYRVPALDDLGCYLLARDVDDAEITTPLELGQEIDGVVGDAGAHRRQRG